LDNIRASLKAASKPPWTYQQYGPHSITVKDSKKRPIAVLDDSVKSSSNTSLFVGAPLFIGELLAEVRRLRSEAIVWHPWPGEKPPDPHGYLITFVDEFDSAPSIMICFWYGDDSWDLSGYDKITAWAELPAPYGGAGG